MVEGKEGNSSQCITTLGIHAGVIRHVSALLTLKYFSMYHLTIKSQNGIEQVLNHTIIIQANSNTKSNIQRTDDGIYFEIVDISNNESKENDHCC
jgi:hypothetical protein